MAHLEHLKILELGATAWNEWRYANPTIAPNLRGAGLGGANLRGANLSEADLIKANLSRTCLNGADLSGANLSGVAPKKYDGQGSSMNSLFRPSRATPPGADLSRADLGHAVLIRANLRGSILMKANLIRANLIRADLSGADLRGAELINADVSGAALVNAILKETNLSGANLSGVDFSGADLTWADLVDSDLSGANLSGANLTKANLSYANISGADISGSNHYKWKIQGIKCTHIIWNSKEIEYSNPADFEKAFAEVESIIQILLDLPFSELSFLTGSFIEQAVNQKYGKGSILFKGQTAISDDKTIFEFLSFSDKFEEINNKLSELQNQLKPAIEATVLKNKPKGVIGIKSEIPIPFTKDVVVVRPKELERVLIERYCQMSPIIQDILQIIQLHIR